MIVLFAESLRNILETRRSQGEPVVPYHRQGANGEEGNASGDNAFLEGANSSSPGKVPPISVLTTKNVALEAPG
jgi:hypothetical protein